MDASHRSDDAGDFRMGTGNDDDTRRRLRLEE